MRKEIDHDHPNDVWDILWIGANFAMLIILIAIVIIMVVIMIAVKKDTKNKEAKQLARVSMNDNMANIAI